MSDAEREALKVQFNELDRLLEHAEHTRYCDEMQSAAIKARKVARAIYAVVIK